ncbi:uncharacterized protein LOC109134998 [Beta vulgaris subsp. vulgaris]|uniref:uncharacterized protein LOC109134998 n=1 Tax=Beta vulgaris subsp. vulgaris TaxID=3555 RepID=UPI002036A806|nr:uncharacterized protein LOC109134998 [Beta vulgaris subsp. vulgaris]XP_048500846.1 uncharacterized protein LOC109134998 [Beta vulgaris subsp. vulgaris]XP_048500847.1 uncharacterized protein LOC109134998 [Beta vulgaris subsp. vulgaris]
MPPKPARQFTPIPAPAGGRGAGRGSSPKEDDKDSMPLVQRRSNLAPQKRKAETAKEQPAAKKAPTKVAPTVVIPESVSLISGRVAEVGSSSLRPKIYKQLTLPVMVPRLESFAKPRKVGYLERSRLELPELLKMHWSSPVKDGEKFEPKLNILDDESLLLDRPLEGGNLGYRLLNATQLKFDIPVDEVQAPAAVHAHNLALPAQFGKELRDLYRYFQTSYFQEVRDHKELKCKMVVKE